jgi:hypothetical protein
MSLKASRKLAIQQSVNTFDVIVFNESAVTTRLFVYLYNNETMHVITHEIHLQHS